MVRFKNRYLLIKFEFDDRRIENYTAQYISNLLREEVRKSFGDLGLGQSMNMSVKYFNPLTGMGIVRAPRDSYRTVWGAVTLLNKCNERTCKVEVLKISGTIRKCQLHAIDFDRNFIRQYNYSDKDFEEYRQSSIQIINSLNP